MIISKPDCQNNTVIMIALTLLVLIVYWLFYMGTLVPVIGFIQVGRQSWRIVTPTYSSLGFS